MGFGLRGVSFFWGRRRDYRGASLDYLDIILEGWFGVPDSHPIAWLLTALTGGLSLVSIPEEDEKFWKDVLYNAEQLGLAPLLWSRLRDRCDEPVLPPGFTMRLSARYLTNASSNRRHVEELGRVLRRLDASGIPAIVLKGACLADLVYGDIALRTFGDADIMVRAADLEKVAGQLEELGYRSESVHDEDAFDETRHHLPVFSKPGGLAVELHWTLVKPRIGPRFTPAELDGVWERSIPFVLGDGPGLTLCPEDMLLYLCLHTAAIHLFAHMGLRACFDVAELLHRYGEGIDWNRFLRRSEAWGFRSSAALTLLSAQETANAAVPISVLRSLGAYELPGGVVEQARSNMFDPDASLLTNPLVEFETSSLMQKFRPVFRSLFPPRKTLAVMYSAPRDSWMIYFYYPARWRDLVFRHGRNLFCILRKDKRLLTKLHGQDVLIRLLRSSLSSAGQESSLSRVEGPDHSSM